MKKQIILTFDDEECGEFQSHLNIETNPSLDSMEVFEVLFGATTNISKDILEEYKKFSYPRTGDSPEAITAQAMNDIVKAYIKYIKRMHECEDF